MDDECHIAQVSVLPSHGGRGIGRALIEKAIDIATVSGLESVTLTTFRDVQWNAPYYGRLGFKIIDDDDIGSELRQIFKKEERFASPRVCLRRSLETD